MADSTYLKLVVEPFVVKWVSDSIGMPLIRRRMVVGPRIDRTNVYFEFDGVSDDGSVGLLVSTTLTLKPGGVRKLHVDASVLLQAPFQRRIMAFISEDTRVNFQNKCDGLLALQKIEMTVCDSIPSVMHSEIARFQSVAKKEVGDRGKSCRPGKPRR